MTSLADLYLDEGLAPGNPWASVSVACQGVDKTDEPGYGLGMPEPAGERVTMGHVLGILTEAGGTGITGPEIARQFTYDTLQRRMCVVNQVLYRLRNRQRVIRGPKEPTKYYHRVPTYRWFITPAGAHYLATGMAEGARQARWEQAERKRAELDRHRRHLDGLLTGAYETTDPQTSPKCERERVMRELRTAGCTLDSIGDVFGVSRERVRQILNRQKITPCRCSRCAAQQPEAGYSLA